MPKVSVIMPVYNGEKYIREAIESVITQTFTDWDFWIIHEYGCTDKCVEIIQEYVTADSRFHLIQNDTRLGLAESLNKGFRLAQGEYLARLDADDLAHPDRFEKQVEFMDTHRNVGICGTYQHHFGESVDSVHKPPVTADECRARLLFNCDLCHSTLFLRRSTVMENGLFYDSSFQAEDYELWCRAIMVTDIENIPEILGEYRWEGNNITVSKKQALNKESGYLVAANLQRIYHMELADEESQFFCGWENPFDRFSAEKRKEKLQVFEEVLRKIYAENLRRRFVSNQAMLNSLARKWNWVKYNTPWDAVYSIVELNEIFSEQYFPGIRARYKRFCKNNPTMKSKLKKITLLLLRPFFRPFKTRIEGMFYRSEERICQFIEQKTWDRYLRLNAEISRLETSLEKLEQTLQAQISTAKNYVKIEVEAHLSKVEQAIAESMGNQIIAVEQRINQTTDSRIYAAEQLINQTTDCRIYAAEQLINQTTDGRIYASEQFINQAIDGRIYAAEQLINQTTDGRIYAAEQLINQTTDGRIYVAEQLINQTTDGRIYASEQFINQTTDGRIYAAEQYISQTVDTRIWKAEKTISEPFNSIDKFIQEIHRHIDFTYRDLMVAMERQKSYLPDKKIRLITGAPIAYKSLDHLYPHGTIRDNTRHPRFVEKCEEMIGRKENLAFLDLGCSGGGMVLEAALRGHISIGLEGSDCSKKEQRAEWRLLGDRLQTCDITQPFRLETERGERQQFDIITAWEVLEHIQENDLPQLFQNVKNHLADDGYFIASIANWDDIDPTSGINWHVTLHPYIWWNREIEKAGFTVCSEMIQPIDLARGAYNPPHCYELPCNDFNSETCFYIVAKKIRVTEKEVFIENF